MAGRSPLAGVVAVVALTGPPPGGGGRIVHGARPCCPGTGCSSVRSPWRSHLRPQARATSWPSATPGGPDRILVKRVGVRRPGRGTLVVGGRHPAGQHRQPRLRARCPRPAVVGRAVYRYAPTGQETALARAGGVRIAVMACHKDELERLLPARLPRRARRAVARDVRAMRAECQEAETALSYLRRMAQGRLDLVHACLDHHGSDALRDLDSLVDACRRSSARARPGPRARRPAPDGRPTSRRPTSPRSSTPCSTPTTSARSELERAELRHVAGQLTAIEHRVSDQRGPCTSASTPSRPRSSAGTRPGGLRRRPAGLSHVGRSAREPGAVPKQLPELVNELGLVHPRAAHHGPAVAAAAVGAGRDLQPLPEPDRAGPAPPVGGDPPADRQGPAHLGRDALRPGRHPRARTGETDLARQILADPHLTEEQKQALIRIYLSFRHENEDVRPTAEPEPARLRRRPGSVAAGRPTAGDTAARSGGSRAGSVRRAAASPAERGPPR